MSAPSHQTLDSVASPSRRVRPARPRQSDIVRALRAAKEVDQGLRVRVEPDGAIIIGHFTPGTQEVKRVRDFTL